MRIAQVVAPWLPVPPVGYGGIEAVVSLLTEELVKRGHDVTLFAAGDSKTSAKLSSVYPKALGNDGNLKKNHFILLNQILPAFKNEAQFDIIHSHGPKESMFFAELVKTPVVHTIHGTITQGDASSEKFAVYKKFAHQNFVSISNAQRTGIPELHYVATVYNGIDIAQFPPRTGNGNYLVWLGRITTKKGILETIKVAQALDLPLKIAAFVDPVDQPFFDSKVKPLLSDKIEFLGQLNHEERAKLLGDAKVFLFPIKWQEPFGLVMVEAMATGTPVVAFDRGSVSEVVVDGKTGYVVSGTDPINLDEIDTAGVERMTSAVKKILSLDEKSYQDLRKASRSHVESHFTVKSMVDGYEAVYREIAHADQ